MLAIPSMSDLPGVIEGGMSGRNEQRKPGTTRGSPRRSRTAKALRISRDGEIAMCPRVGRMGPISDDAPGQHNLEPSEGPWGGGHPHPPWRCAIESPARHSAGIPGLTARRTKDGRKPAVGLGMPGAGLTGQRSGKAPSERPAFQPYWGKPNVRNDRGGGGNVGIIRSPIRATALPD